MEQENRKWVAIGLQNNFIYHKTCKIVNKFQIISGFPEKPDVTNFFLIPENRKNMCVPISTASLYNELV